MRKVVVGVMGPGAGAKKQDVLNAFEVGKLIAEQGWILLSGGRNEGVMDASCRGAQSAGGTVIGVIPGSTDESVSPAVDIAIITGMGSGRNNINVLTSNVLIACGMGAGTASEVSLALKAGKDVVLLSEDQESKQFFQSLDRQHVHIAESPAQALERCQAVVELAQPAASH